VDQPQEGAVAVGGEQDLDGARPWRRYRVLAIPVGAALFIELIVIVARRTPSGEVAVVRGTADTIGRVLFTQYLLPFELTSVLLLAAMVGVLLLARRRVQ